MIRLFGVTQHYCVRPVLQDINLAIEDGELIAVVGPNGMGKSTLLACIAGVLEPQHGRVEIDGVKRRSSMEAERELRRKVVYLPDRPWLPKMRTGREYLISVGQLYGISADRLLQHIPALLKLFELEKCGDSAIESYSTGQQKKIALCGVLVTEAPVLLLDEPFSGGLDPSGILALKAVLSRISEHGKRIIVMTTPVPELVEGLADRIILLRHGQILAFDSAEGLRSLVPGAQAFSEVLEKLTHPETLSNIDEYFTESLI
jgi:ABC-2 type transport system ATP-binding protein